MNSALVTTGIVPLCIGSVETFQVQPWLDGVLWDLTGGNATLTMTDPEGHAHALVGIIQGRGAVATWTVAAPEGVWVRAWTLQDSSGRKQVSRPITFQVISSPGIPITPAP